MTTLDIFDPITQAIFTVDLPPPQKVFPVRWYYGAVWSKHRNSILYWGGVNKDYNVSLSPVENGVTELFTDSMDWRTMPTEGTAPVVRHHHCMVTNEDGSKVFIYGGSLRNYTVVGELWILDVKTSTWSQKQSGPIRMDAACAVAGDQLLVWGGTPSWFRMEWSEMIIYNFNTSAYVYQYIPPSGYKDLKPPLPLTRTTAPWPTQTSIKSGDSGFGVTDSGNKGPGSSQVGPGMEIAGGVVGGLVLLCVIVGVLLMRRRRLRKGQEEREDEDSAKGEQNTPSGLLPDHAAQCDRGINGGKVTERGPWKSPQDDANEKGSRGAKQDYTDADMALQELMDQQRELEQKRQLLVLMQQGLTLDAASSILESSQHARGPAAVTGDQSDYYLPPPPPSIPTPTQPLERPTRLSPIYSQADTLIADAVTGRPTVQAMPGLVVYESGGSDGYADGYDGARPRADIRRESDLAQEKVEPKYGPSPAVNNATPDLVYEPSADVGMDWTRRQQENNPHTLIDSSSSL